MKTKLRRRICASGLGPVRKSSILRGYGYISGRQPGRKDISGVGDTCGAAVGAVGIPWVARPCITQLLLDSPGCTRAENTTPRRRARASGSALRTRGGYADRPSGDARKQRSKADTTGNEMKMMKAKEKGKHAPEVGYSEHVADVAGQGGAEGPPPKYLRPDLRAHGRGGGGAAAFDREQRNREEQCGRWVCCGGGVGLGRARVARRVPLQPVQVRAKVGVGVRVAVGAQHRVSVVFAPAMRVD